MPVVTSSPVQLLPPVPTTCAPAPVPLLVPGMVVTPPAVSAVTSPISQGSKAGFSSLEEALKALNLQSPAELLDIITTSLQGSLDKVKSSITVYHKHWISVKIKNMLINKHTVMDGNPNSFTLIVDRSMCCLITRISFARLNYAMSVSSFNKLHNYGKICDL